MRVSDFDKAQRLLTLASAGLLLTATVAVASPASRAGTTGNAAQKQVEGYLPVPMPPGFHVEISPLDGPVFADARGHTLYEWPMKKMRNGYSGEPKGMPGCYDKVSTEEAGLMSPYPAGVLLPDLDKRPSCTDLWPPVLAAADAKPVGKWTIIDRKDGTRQWAYDEQPLYTSVYDHAPGETAGGSRRDSGGTGAPGVRVPVGPPSRIPPGFAVASTSTGRLLTTDKNYSVYANDDETLDKIVCDVVCARTWKPILAPQLFAPQEDWSVVERSPGVMQWAYRGHPLYTYTRDSDQWSLEGSDVPGWHNVYTQRAPSPPESFTVQDTLAGQVLADSRGHTIYIYHCGDDSVDQLSCDHPQDTQVYRLAVCGGGDAQVCQQKWPYVTAPKGAHTNSHVWSAIQIDPKTGHLAQPGQADALSVWAYRGRPVYTFFGDEQPGDVYGDGFGEWRGRRNGLKAFWLRDDFFGGTR